MFSYGTVIAFIATLDPILKSMGYADSNQTTAITILFAMLVGTLASPVFSSLIKRTKKYKLITCLSNILLICRYHRMLCLFRGYHLCLYHKGRVWCNYCRVCRIGRLLPHSERIPLFGVLCWKCLPYWWRICRWLSLCGRTDFWGYIRSNCYQCNWLKSKTTLPDMPDSLLSFHNYLIFLYRSNKGRA